MSTELVGFRGLSIEANNPSEVPYFLSESFDLLKAGEARIFGAAFVDTPSTMRPAETADILRPISVVPDPGLQAYTICRPWVVGSSLVVIDNWLVNNRLTGSNPAQMNPGQHPAITVDPEGKIYFAPEHANTDTLSGRYMVAAGEGDEMYHHWLADLLPRVIAVALDIRFSDVKFLIPVNAPSYVKETMLLLGVVGDRAVLFDPTRVIQVDELVLSAVPMYDYRNCGAAALRVLREALLGAVPPADVAYERVIFTRRDAPNAERLLINEDELIDRLGSEGFVPLESGRFSVAQQISIINNAKICLCVHGSAGANLVFSRQGSRVLHLFPDCVHYFYAHGIATSIAGAIYGHVFGPSFQRGVRAHNNPWLLSPYRVLSSIDRLQHVRSM